MQLKIPFNVLAGLLAFMGSMAFAQDGQTSRPLVVATIKPLAIIAKSALGESADVEYLQASNQSPHDLSLPVSALEKLDRADLVLWIGEDFEARVAKTLNRIPVSRRITALELPLVASDTETARQDHLGVDPHVWLNPENANVIAKAIQKKLGRPLKNIITDNQVAELAAQLVPFAKQNYLTHHDAFGHFVSTFNLSAGMSIRDASGGQQGAKTQYLLRKTATKNNARCIFVEPQYADKDALVLAQQLQLPLKPLDPQGFDQRLTADGYQAFLSGLAVQFKACFE
jgi:zinc transport system substrate-binding protein